MEMSLILEIKVMMINRHQDDMVMGRGREEVDNGKM